MKDKSRTTETLPQDAYLSVKLQLYWEVEEANLSDWLKMALKFPTEVFILEPLM